MKRPKLNEVPPDAGASYLGAYGINNEWTLWLMARDASLLSLSPRDILKSDIGSMQCPKCPAAFPPVMMVFRPGEFVCYRHEPPLRIKHVPKMEPMRLYTDDDAPVKDVISLIGKERDVEYRDGKWRVVVRKLPRQRRGKSPVKKAMKIAGELR